LCLVSVINNVISRASPKAHCEFAARDSASQGKV
jgi:hypothetical protein